MAFKEVSNSRGPVFKWDTAGKTLEGVYHGLKTGKTFAGNAAPSKLLVIETADGVIAAGAPTALAGKLQDSAKVGQRIRITYTGMERGQSGVQYKAFKLEVDDSGAIVETTPSVGSTDTQETYAALIAKLTAKVGPDTSRLMADMLQRSHSDISARSEALRNLLRQQGVVV
jgi:hypothetical protein